MRLDWSVKALIDFDQAQAYIAHENPVVAKVIGERIWQAGRQLAESPLMGRQGTEPDTRHWVVQRTPYLIVYRVTTASVEIVRVWHGRRAQMGID